MKDIEENNDNSLPSLNKEQNDAVCYVNGPLLVLAGAGTGKTRVLTYRIMHLISENYAMGHEILAVTFTNKAAQEMKSRVSAMIPAQGLSIGTFHSIAARILRQNAEYFGLNSNFIIIDTQDQIKLIKTLMIEKNHDIKKFEPKIIHGIISRWKDLGLTYSKVSNSDLKTPYCKIAIDIYRDYQENMISSNLADYGDLLLYNVELFLNDSTIARIYQNKFKYILIDEYQDVNAVQYLWARLLSNIHGNLCCVGDDDQSIYSWRGADVSNILRFERDFPNAKIVKLEQNYRSSSYILKAASSLISNNDLRHSKTLWTESNTASKIKTLGCYNDKEESRSIALIIEDLVSKGIKRDEIAILVRTSFLTRVFEEEFISRSLSYKIIGGPKFYERSEIKDVLAYLRLIVNRDDNLALERIINTPKRGIGPSSLNQIRSYSKDQNISLYSAIKYLIENNIFKNKLLATMSDFVTKLDSWVELIEGDDLYSSVKAILEDVGYFEMLKNANSEDAGSRIDNIYEMLRAISEYPSIIEFIEHISLVSDVDNSDESSRSVSLMTLHAAKGMEFEVVFLPGWEEGIFPHQKTLLEEGAKGLEEERRIAYVGITRAKNHLYISYADRRRVYNEYVNTMPSRFLSEIPRDLTESISSNGYSWNNNLQSKNYSNIELSNYQNNSIKDLTDLKIQSGFKPGTRVKHNSFGIGIIIKISDDIAEIAFATGSIKKIKTSYLKIT